MAKFETVKVFVDGNIFSVLLNTDKIVAIADDYRGNIGGSASARLYLDSTCPMVWSDASDYGGAVMRELILPWDEGKRLKDALLRED